MNPPSKRFSGWIFAALCSVASFGSAWADQAAPAKTQATENPAKAAQTAKTAPARKPLDLRAPNIDRVFSRTQIETLTSRPDDVSENAETVDVEGARHERIIAPSGLRGLAWGVRHPTQAWRLFVPSPSE
jgi:hypothetical protein